MWFFIDLILHYDPENVNWSWSTIKLELADASSQSDAVLSESLRRLQLMELSVDVLKVLILHSFVSFLFYMLDSGSGRIHYCRNLMISKCL